MNIILLHGALGSARQFHGLIAALNGPECHAFDFEGHGLQGQTNRPYRIEYFAENLRDYIAARGLAPARIMGYSMGGYVGLWLAAQMPELVGGVMTLGTKFAWTGQFAAAETQKLNPENLMQKAPQFVAGLEAAHPVAGWQSVLEKTAGMMTELGANPLLTPGVLAGITCPVRLGIGDRDKTVNYQETHQAFTALPNAQLYMLPGAPHPFERVNATLLSALVRDFADTAI